MRRAEEEGEREMETGRAEEEATNPVAAVIEKGTEKAAREVGWTQAVES